MKTKVCKLCKRKRRKNDFWDKYCYSCKYNIIEPKRSSKRAKLKRIELIKNLNKKSNCYFCKNRINLEIHHIDRNRGDNAKKNLIVLCRGCHHKIHAKINLFNKLKLFTPHAIDKGVGKII